MKYNETALYSLMGKRIRNLRNQHELTQQQLASALDLPRTSLTNIESGGQRISIYLLFEISRILNVAVTDILPSTEELDRKSTIDLPPATANFVREFMEDEL